MGRELRRVPLDFEWPTGKVWKGYINPHYKKCPEDGRTCFNGENAASIYLQHLTSMFGVIADSAKKGQTHPYLNHLPYKSDHPDWAVQPKEVREKFVDLTRKLTNKKKDDPLGFGGSDHEIFFKILALAGIKNPKKGRKKPAYDWGHCSVCKGEHLDPAVKKEYNAWKEYGPPKGEGFQLWETTSEGSPMSPVFSTLDALCAWAEKHASTCADWKTTAAEWKRMLGQGLVYHQEGNAIFM
jgi:hypothetical protein